MSFIPQSEPWFDDNEANALKAYIESQGWGTEFRKTAELEEALQEFTGARRCVMTTSGTVSLTLALLAAGVTAGDEVIVPDLTMIATANAAKLIGAVPVFVDIEPKTLNLDISLVEAAITPRTRAVVHVSLNGRSNDIPALLALCQKTGATLVEDAAQSLGSYHGGAHLGTIGDIGCLSFSTPKIISTGQGGAVLINDEALAAGVRTLKDFGRASGGNDIHDSIGFNFKFTDFQAVIGLEQMKKLSWRIDRKKDIWNRFRDQLSAIAEISWIDTDTDFVTPWFIDIFVEDRDGLARHLKENDIGSRPIYPPLHSQKAYGREDLSFPVTEHFAARGLWLPSSSKLLDHEIDHITATIHSFFKG
jgi:perosamine synthetase